jgi:hypothetical protein
MSKSWIAFSATIVVLIVLLGGTITLKEISKDDGMRRWTPNATFTNEGEETTP